MPEHKTFDPALASDHVFHRQLFLWFVQFFTHTSTVKAAESDIYVISPKIFIRIISGILFV
jgi:hypothetical protein